MYVMSKTRTAAPMEDALQEVDRTETEDETDAA